MTAIFLIFFSILFYQFLVKPALNPTMSPNANRNYSQTEEKKHLMQIWRDLQQFQGEKRERKQHIKTKEAQKENASNSQTEGFKGGEYIEYEEM